MPSDRRHETFETDQPWIIYSYGRTHDRWWPPHNSTRILGYGKIGMECCICGETAVAKIKIPRFGNAARQDKHPLRVQFLLDHIHRDKPHPMSWVKPLRNPVVFGREGIDLDLLAMRLEADLSAATKGDTP